MRRRPALLCEMPTQPILLYEACLPGQVARPPRRANYAARARPHPAGHTPAHDAPGTLANGDDLEAPRVEAPPAAKAHHTEQVESGLTEEDKGITYCGAGVELLLRHPLCSSRGASTRAEAAEEAEEAAQETSMVSQELRN